MIIRSPYAPYPIYLRGTINSGLGGQIVGAGVAGGSGVDVASGYGLGKQAFSKGDLGEG